MKDCACYGTYTCDECDRKTFWESLPIEKQIGLLSLNRALSRDDFAVYKQLAISLFPLGIEDIPLSISCGESIQPTKSMHDFDGIEIDPAVFYA